MNRVDSGFVRPFCLLTQFAVLLVLALSGCSDGSSQTPMDGATASQIQGTVIDERSGEAIRGASIRTDPPSEEVISDINGQFTIRINANVSNAVRVVVNHFAYTDRQTEVTPLPGDVALVNFALQSSAIGLHASASSVFFPQGTTRQSLRLSSNVQNTGFSTIAIDPWISVIPTSGVITNRETAVLQIMVDQDHLPTLPAQSEIVINSDNGTRELVITLIFQDGGDLDSNSLLHPRQNDCRQDDVLRFGFDDPAGPIVRFPESVLLPSGAGLRQFDVLGNPFLIDSIVVEELGSVTIEHLSGGPEDSSLELFEIDKEDTINSLSINTGASASNQRATIVNWALVPGVYCYYLGGTEENFTDAIVYVNINFTPAQ